MYARSCYVVLISAAKIHSPDFQRQACMHMLNWLVRTDGCAWPESFDEASHM